MASIITRLSLKKHAHSPQLESSKVTSLETSTRDAHIASLPTELLQHIFLLTLSPPLALLATTSSPSPIIQVCKDWRNIILQTAELWAAVHIELPAEAGQKYRSLLIKQIELWLERSKSTLLRFSIRNHCAYADSTLASSVLQLFVAHSWRWEMFSFHEFHWTDLSPLRKLESEAVPMLHSVCLHPRAWSSWRGQLPWMELLGFLGNAPVLQTFEFHDLTQHSLSPVSAELVFPTVSFANLSYLTLRIAGRREWALTRKLLDALVLCINLRYLEWSEEVYFGSFDSTVPESARVGTLAFTKLETLAMSTDIQLYSFVLDCLSVPSLTDFQFAGALARNGDQLHELLSRFFNRHGATVRRICFIPSFIYPYTDRIHWGSINWLHLCPSLETLVLGPKANIPRALERIYTDGSSLIHLQLRLDYDDHIELDLILGTLSSLLYSQPRLKVDIDSPFRDGRLNARILQLGTRTRLRYPMVQDPPCTVGQAADCVQEEFLADFPRPLEFVTVQQGLSPVTEARKSSFLSKFQRRW